MKIKLLLSLLLSLNFCLLSSQVPQGFNYQALAGDAAGNPLRYTDLQVKIDILTDTITPVIVWEELHPKVKTNSQGILAVIIGTGERQPASTVEAFNKINWSSAQVFLKTQILYQGAWKNMGSAKLWNVPYAMVAGELSGAVGKLTIEGDSTSAEHALFEVKNNNGQTVFAVYNGAVRVYVDDMQKGAKGGFAIGGFGSAKQPSQNYFVVTPDTIRMYIDDTPGKGAKGGFAIGGFGSSKSPSRQFLIVNADSIRAYIDTNTGKGAKGGFAIGGFGSSKATGEEYLRVTRDSTRIYLNDSGTKGAKGGFAIGGFGSSKGVTGDYFLVSPDSTRIYVRKDTLNGSSTFNIVSVGQDMTQKSLMTANPDTVNIAGVLNLQNNLVVRGNIDIGGTLNVITDIDGNSYKTVQIGTQVWMAENLKTTKYNDGTGIPLVTDNAVWAALTTPAYCWYNNDEAANKPVYGALYNWYTVDAISNGGKNVCPTGWHVPTDAEGTTLTDYLTNNGYGYGGSGTAIGKSMAATSGWLADGTAGNIGNDQASNNSSGFAALPGGECGPGGWPYGVENYGRWWSSIEYDVDSAMFLGMGYEYSDVWIGPTFKKEGFSVRCLQGEVQILPVLSTTAVSSVTPTTAISGGNITFDGGKTIIARGVCWSTTSGPTTANSKTIDGSGTGSFTSSLAGLSPNTTYYIRAYVTTNVETTYGLQLIFKTFTGTATDIDGNVYNSITIGTQIWLAENLKTTKYNDGTPIPDETVDVVWAGLDTVAYCWYNNDAATYKATYGALYNWYAVDAISNGGKNVCPTGWHVPTNDEWQFLVMNLDPVALISDSISFTAGGKLKEAGTTHWISPNVGATNETGFTALPGGGRHGNGIFYSIGDLEAWWSSTQNNSNAWDIGVNYNSPVAFKNSLDKKNGYSVRCLQGELQILPVLSTTAVSSVTPTTAISGGNITSDGGNTIIVRGVCWSTTSGPTTANSKTTNGSGTGSFTSSLAGLSPNTTYYIRAYVTTTVETTYGLQLIFKTFTGTATDIDGNVYNSITIGTQIWLAENLKTTKYNDNAGIPLVTDNVGWAALTTPAYCWYNNDEVANKPVYGALYNWYAVDAISNGSKNVCPISWHVPSDAEWTTLENYLIANGYNYDGTTTGNKIAKALASTTLWTSSATTGAVGNTDYSAKRNATDFTVLPGGFRGNDGAFYNLGISSYMWSTMELDATYAWFRNLRNDRSDVYGYYQYKKNGFFVRCLKD